ncbi:STAS domain-containing protein [Streptomyces sp900105245]|uniref:Anti-sigma factor antagonist n=1 Tax=Streptomyces sp. 900105245 TaxID=3154379 RepID=A0ABV1UKI3_9ACTN
MVENENARRPEPLRVASTATNGVTVVRVSGQIDHASADPLIAALQPDTLGDQRRVIIDMRQVTFLDSTGINILLAGHRDLTPAGWLRLAGARNAVIRTLELVGVDTVIPCYPTLQEALTG